MPVRFCGGLTDDYEWSANITTNIFGFGSGIGGLVLVVLNNRVGSVPTDTVSVVLVSQCVSMSIGYYTFLFKISRC